MVIGCAGSRPGNNQPCDRAARHQVRSRSSRLGESMTLRSLPPLPRAVVLRLKLKRAGVPDVGAATGRTKMTYRIFRTNR